MNSEQISKHAVYTCSIVSVTATTVYIPILDLCEEVWEEIHNMVHWYLCFIVKNIIN